MVPARRTETLGEIPIRPRHNSPEIVNIDNGRVNLKNSLRGKTIFINFWILVPWVLKNTWFAFRYFSQGI